MDVSDLVARPFGWGSALRGRRFFHPSGVLTAGSVERVAPGQDGLPIPSTDVIARISKAVGTPGPLPDFIGLALRIPPSRAGASLWDILLVSAGSGVLTRAALLRPATSWSGQTLTSLMPFRYRDHPWWLRARIADDIGGAGLSLDHIRERVRDGGIEIDLDQACGTGDFEPLARLSLSSVVETDDVSFDPVLNTAPELGLYPGWLAHLRARAYQRSREGREAE
jgi:hypothetical protein